MSEFEKNNNTSTGSQLDLSAVDVVKPPEVNVGVVGWIKKNLFSSPFNSGLTILLLILSYFTIIPFVNWALIIPLLKLFGMASDVEGANWAVISTNWHLLVYGLYPKEEVWRPTCAIFIMIGMLFISTKKQYWNKKLFYGWPISICVMAFLMKGGLFLPNVDTDQWGGVSVTLILSVFGMFVAYPLGVLLALGRQSKMPVVQKLCIIYIEIIRGVPLISLLFTAAVILPLFLPGGMTLSLLLRALCVVVLFTAAYIAEVVRGGLQGMPKGQYEAAQSMGLNYFQTMRLIILPQALKMVIPPTVSVLIAAIKDTTLVSIIGIYDLLNTTKTVVKNPHWSSYSTEAYLFLALLFFTGCFSLSKYSKNLEKDLARGHKN